MGGGLFTGNVPQDGNSGGKGSSKPSPFQRPVQQPNYLGNSNNTTDIFSPGYSGRPNYDFNQPTSSKGGGKGGGGMPGGGDYTMDMPGGGMDARYRPPGRPGMGYGGSPGFGSTPAPNTFNQPNYLTGNITPLQAQLDDQEIPTNVNTGSAGKSGRKGGAPAGGGGGGKAGGATPAVQYGGPMTPGGGY